MIVVGVDPGGRWTGVVTRAGASLLAATVVTRTTGGRFPDKTYIHEVLATIRDHRNAQPGASVAHEEVDVPNPHVRVTNPAGVMGTAMIVGAVVAVFPESIEVPTGGHGSGPRPAYPAALWGAREGKAGKGVLRHCRSAWDIAAASLLVPSS